ncbi:MAG: hypothetical protein F6K18_03460 [Okeania sp. SIO2C2]|uniref:hypothetical protein n=1 Tax=Okeania sp. SIO2C2 TaxID=2607787 RepID=UPI0013B6C449|nr:hypothetical protein [Okeania sp. SIO2C2]NEP85951.1 hypothetical protein [Okeania sp. SIO2C2]
MVLDPKIKNKINYRTQTVNSFPLLPTPSFLDIPKKAIAFFNYAIALYKEIIF